MADYEEEDERWVMVRRCMNDILGDRRSQDQSTEIESVQSRISDLESTVESEVAAVRSEIALLGR